jgi:hypothetical protein
MYEESGPAIYQKAHNLSTFCLTEKMYPLVYGTQQMLNSNQQLMKDHE